MAPVRLIEKPVRRDAAGAPLDMRLAWLLMAMAWVFAGYFGVRLLDPRSDLQTTLLTLSMVTAYQVCAFAVAARARSPRR
ncbi:MAG TPA: hypothetical protein VL460_11475 [Caulobacteraceae bacterium]|jgi:hypothetical protein|nr:hypothetical protein [Caulobacteraceae bacterium]